MERVFIVAAKRTPIGKFNGALASLSAAELGAQAMQAVLKQTDLDAHNIDEVIAGHVLSAGTGMGAARQAALKAGLAQSTPAYGVNMICGSGMKAIMEAASHIRSNDADLVIAAGMESMSNAPFLSSATIRRGTKLGHQALEDSILKDGLTDAFHHYPMGITAENIANALQITRQQQDEFALQSQRKAQLAIENGRFEAEICPVEIKIRGELQRITRDEYPKFDCQLASLEKLKPAFDPHGSVTAGNASGINDGASALILASEKAVKAHHLTPLAEILSYGQAGVAPEVMGLGPVPAIANTLHKAGIALKDIQAIELNEAFAAQAIGVMKQLSEEHKVELNELSTRTNINGGAIALGHPIGASGNRIVTSLVYQLLSHQLDYGLASVCIGGGMGTAIVIKRCQGEIR